MLQSWANYFLGGGTPSNADNATNDQQNKETGNLGVENQCNARLAGVMPDDTVDEWVWVDQPQQHSSSKLEDVDEDERNSETESVADYPLDLAQFEDDLFEENFYDECHNSNGSSPAEMIVWEGNEVISDDLDNKRFGNDDDQGSGGCLSLVPVNRYNNCHLLEGSWFITPPPCFMSTGPPVELEMSPLENLLIEHPSMSVYNGVHAEHSGRRRGPLKFLEDEISNTEGNSRFVKEKGTSKNKTNKKRVSKTKSGGNKQQTQSVEHKVQEVNGGSEKATKATKSAIGAVCCDVVVKNTNRMLAIQQQQDKQDYKFKQAQKVQLQIASQALKRGCLPIQNKAREFNGRNRRQRRGERSQGATRSCVNNNRKC